MRAPSDRQKGLSLAEQIAQQVPGYQPVELVTRLEMLLQLSIELSQRRWPYYAEHPEFDREHQAANGVDQMFKMAGCDPRFRAVGLFWYRPRLVWYFEGQVSDGALAAFIGLPTSPHQTASTPLQRYLGMSIKGIGLMTKVHGWLCKARRLAGVPEVKDLRYTTTYPHMAPIPYTEPEFPAAADSQIYQD